MSASMESGSSDAAGAGHTGPRPVVGEIWDDAYRIEEMIEFSSQTGLRKWRGRTVERDQPVVLVDFPSPEHAARAALWPSLESFRAPHLQRAWDCRAKRVEVYRETPGEALLGWRDGVETMEMAVVERFVQQMGSALHALHDRGLAHLGVEPEHVTVEAHEDQPDFWLGGLECTVALERGQTFGLSPNPYYAPPEAMGIYQHEAGDALRSWDWWSLGRTIQTLVLGQPVLGAVLKRDLRTQLKVFQNQAAELTMDRLSGVRFPGAIEPMGTLEPRLERLLRGLLAANPDGRWGWLEIQEWMAGESPPEYYTLSRNARLFRWRKRSYTVTDAARLLRRPEHWTEGVRSVLEEDPASLRGFVEGPGGDPGAAQHLRSLEQLAQSSTFADQPPPLVREVVAALGLHELSGGGPFIWRGERLHPDALRQWLAEDGPTDGLAIIHLLTRPKILQQIQTHDGGAVQFLRSLARVAEGAEQIIRTQGWLDLEDATLRKRLWREALDPEAELRSTLEAFRRRYASSSQPGIDALFQKPEPPMEELLALAVTMEDPDRFGYVSHASREEERMRELREEGRRLHHALFWHRLGRSAGVGFLLFAHWPAWVGLLTLFALLGLVARPGPTWAALALAPFLAAGLLRFLMQQSIAEFVADVIPGAARWRWRDGPSRCRREARKEHAESSPARLLGRMEKINRELAGLQHLQARPEPLEPPPNPVTVWIAAIVSWALFGSLGIFYAWSLWQHPPSWPDIRMAWTGTAANAADAGDVLAIDVGAMQFGPGETVRMEVPEEAGPELLSPEETFALERGRALAAQHALDSQGEPVAVRLPGAALRFMLYDPRTDSILYTDPVGRGEEPPLGETFQIGGVLARYYGP